MIFLKSENQFYNAAQNATYYNLILNHLPRIYYSLLHFFITLSLGIMFTDIFYHILYQSQ